MTACREHAVTALTVTDADASQACVRLAEDHGLLVEPACGTALAPLYSQHPALAAYDDVVASVCGGMVVTLDQLARWSHAGEEATCAAV